jgi:putative SOS response-associated peptidase YedK
VVRQLEDGPQFAFLRWGLIPSWAKDPGIAARTINARADTVAEKPSFRAAFRRRRCLVLADGYYEWRKFPSPNNTFFMASER